MEKLGLGDLECVKWPGYVCKAPCPMANAQKRHDISVGLLESSTLDLSVYSLDERENILNGLINKAIASRCTETPGCLSALINTLINRLNHRR